MNLRDFVRVRSGYTRSINLERDMEIRDGRAYVITSRARQTLNRIVQAACKLEAPRAWALIGPYGAGKSAFGLFLNGLLADPATVIAKRCNESVHEIDAGLAGQYKKLTANSKGFCSILLTGSPEPLGNRLVAAMCTAASRFFSKSKGRPPRIVAQLRQAMDAGTSSVTDTLELLNLLHEAVVQQKGHGVLLLIDELGKFLEYESRHRGGADIFLLQGLAEQSVRFGTRPFIVVVMLHQALELYAQRLGQELKDEWRKVSGRFESIPFVDSSEQILRVVHSALAIKLPPNLAKRVRQEVDAIAGSLDEVKALPSEFHADHAKRVFEACFPLHPTSLLLLPQLCQKVAQNERTLFSYLGSNEPRGFMEVVSTMEFDPARNTPWIIPRDIFDYFILNQPGLTIDHSTHRRWAEVVSALDRIGDVSLTHIDVLKTIGLLNIVGAHGGLRASDKLLALCLPHLGSRQLKTVVEDLRARSLITFRKFSGEYRVWQGSDFDLDAAIGEHKATVGLIDVADVLNRIGAVSPIVARRHAIATGTLRYFVWQSVSRESVGQIHPKKVPTILLCIAESPMDVDLFRDRLSKLNSPLTVGVIYKDGSSLREAIVEVQSLLRIQRESQELANDPVGQRELKDRMLAAAHTQKRLLSAMVEEPNVFEWFLSGRGVSVADKRDLQVRLSALLNTAYSSAPIMRNELINRDKPSSNAVAARKKLLLAMLQNSGHADLGIAKFPPEKAMYRGVVKATGLHRQVGDGWAFLPPSTADGDPNRIMPAWTELLRLLNETGAPVQVTTIYGSLMREPFGLKEGVLPIFLIAAYQALSKEVALCESGQFVPFLTQQVLEGLLDKPEAYSLQKIRTESIHEALHMTYLRVFGSQAKQTDDSLVSMLQPMAKMMMSLPEYSKRTRRISNDAIAVRDLFFAAKSPVQLLFSELPNACRVDLREGPLDQQLKVFAERLQACLTEIRVAYHALLSEVSELLRSAFSLGSGVQLHELRDALRARCLGLESFTIDETGLKAFIGRVTDAFGDETQWLISVATFLARKPPEKWADDDLQAVKYRLGELVSRLTDLRQLQLHYERGKQQTAGDFQAALLRVILTNGGEMQALVSLDERLTEFISSHLTELTTVLERFPSQQAKLAALVALAHHVLRPKEAAESPAIVGPRFA